MSHELPGQIFLQVTVVLIACQIVSFLVRPLHQPAVVGQMVAGLLIGPSVVGLLPHWQELIFPPSSMAVIRALGQVGIVLYMFTVGAEFNLSFLRTNVGGALAVSIGGVLPVGIGALTGAFLLSDHRFFPAQTDSWLSVIFFGAALGVTAFPVMARIIDERNLKGTPIASISLAAASVSDAAAWILLAIVMAGLKRDLMSAALTLVGAASFGVLTVLVLGPLLGRFLSAFPDHSDTGGFSVFLNLMLLTLAAFATELIGIHPAFGAFAIGTVWPRSNVLTVMPMRSNYLVTNLLLPLFFVYAGLNARLGLLGTAQLVLTTLLIIGIACVSKGGICWFAALLAGYSRREAAAIGALMNARGVVELIILSVGLESRIITPTLYTMMVTMAIVTTCLAVPVLSLLRADQVREPLRADSGAALMEKATKDAAP